MINKDVFNQLMEPFLIDQPQIVIEFIDTFIRSSSLNISNIKNFLALNNLNDLIREAHTLRPGAQIIGAADLGDICQQLEDLKSLENKDFINDLTVKLEKFHGECCKELIDIKMNLLNLRQ